MIMNNKFKAIISLVLANGLVYGFNALYYCFIQIYLEQYHDPVTVGILLTIGPFVSIVAPLFWGVRADKAKYKNTILLITVLGSAAFYLLLSVNHSFWWLFAVITALMFFMSPFGGLIDTITLEYTTQAGLPYGPIRLTGTIVFGAMPFILSIFTEKNINVIFYAYIITAVIAAASIIAMPKVKGYASEKERINILPVFKDSKLMVIFAFGFITQFAWGYYMNFFPTYLTGELGLPQWVWGLNTLLTVLGEVPFFLMFNSIFSKFGLKKIMFTAITLSVLRYLCLALFTNAPLLLLTGLITGAAVTLFTYVGSVYINNNIPLKMKASTQTLMYALSVGIPKMIAGFAGGYMTEYLGVRISMLISTGLCTIGLIIYFVRIHGDNSKELMPSLLKK